MPRPPRQPARAEIPADEAEEFDALLARFQGLRHDVHGGPMDSSEIQLTPYAGALLNTPTFAAALQECSKAVRTAGERSDSYSHSDREWVDQVLAYDLGHHGVAYRHTPDAVAVGVRIEAIEALWEGREEDLTPDEQLLTRFVRQVAGGTMDDETWDLVEARLGTRGVVEYTIFVTYLLLVIRLQQAFGEVEGSKEEILALLRDLRDGARDVPDYRLRIR